jgi:hypothetical protein
MDSYIHKLGFKPGDIVGDCDMQQHIISKWLPHKLRLSAIYSNRPFYGYTFSVDQFQKQDGSWSCGCGGGPDKKKTRDELEKEWIEWFDGVNVRERVEEGYWTAKDNKIYKALSNGTHIFDENGLLLREYE